MSRVARLLAMVLIIAFANTVSLAFHLAYPNALASNSTGSGSVALGPVSLSHSTSQTIIQFFLGNSPTLSTASWVLVGGVWIWRGRTKSRWEGLGFDSGIFNIFMKMK